jgi:CBS domain-containing protein
MFIVVGIAMSFGVYVPYFGAGLVGGLWLAFIGWFLYGAAAQATTRLALDDALAGLTVAQLMQGEVSSVDPAISLAVVVQDYLIRGADRALAVVRDGRLLGLICISDVRRVTPEEWSTTPVSAVMRSVESLATVTPDQPLAEAFELLARQDIDQLPVVGADGRLIGMLRRRDVTRWLELAWRPGTPRGKASLPRAREPRVPSFPHGREPHPGPV